jgi:hypothetical protein
MQFSHVTPLQIIEHYRVTCVLTLTGRIGSSEVLLSGPVDASHLLVKHQFRGMGLTSGRYRHDMTNSYLLKMSPEPRSRLTSVLLLHVFGLATCLDALTNGGGMMPTPDCRKPNPYGILSHSVCRWTALRGILCMDSCHSLSAMP